MNRRSFLTGLVSAAPTILLFNTIKPYFGKVRKPMLVVNGDGHPYTIDADSGVLTYERFRQGWEELLSMDEQHPYIKHDYLNCKHMVTVEGNADYQNDSIRILTDEQSQALHNEFVKNNNCCSMSINEVWEPKVGKYYWWTGYAWKPTKYSERDV